MTLYHDRLAPRAKARTAQAEGPLPLGWGLLIGLLATTTLWTALFAAIHWLFLA